MFAFEPDSSDDQRTFPPLRDAVFLTGPTASGKTRIGVELARRLDAEILSLDSMALFQGMDIGTAKPGRDERAAVPHHLLDLVPPSADFSLAEYLSAAHDAALKVREAGKQALFVGGTPLYLKSLLRGLYQGPPADWEFRRQIEEEIAVVGLAALHERLQQVDPLSAAKLHPNDKRRIVRALEVAKLTGKPLSHMQTQFEDAPPEHTMRVYALEWPRPVLHRRIEQRVDAMFAGGLVDEVKALLERYGALSRTASQAVGYREVIEHLDGVRDLPSTIELVKARTRQFARRQETWFRSLPEVQRIPLAEGDAPEDVAARIARI